MEKEEKNMDFGMPTLIENRSHLCIGRKATEGKSSVAFLVL